MSSGSASSSSARPVLEIAGREIDAVLFDAGGIFVIPDPHVIAPLLGYYGASTDLRDYRRAHYAGMAAKSRMKSDERDWSAYNAAYVRSVGVPEPDLVEAADVLGVTRNAWIWRHPLDDSVAALQSLHERGVPIGVVSNASGQIEQVLARSKVCQVGDGLGVPVRIVIDSHVVGVAKPDPRIFDFGLAALSGFERHRIAYVGDSVTMDVMGARAAGLFPVLLDPHDDHEGVEYLDDDGATVEFHRVRSLLEIL
jgi:putative hydrolase of the HAD superfamily